MWERLVISNKGLQRLRERMKAGGAGIGGP